jgi:hypothetical protein
LNTLLLDLVPVDFMLIEQGPLWQNPISTSLKDQCNRSYFQAKIRKFHSTPVDLSAATYHTQLDVYRCAHKSQRKIFCIFYVYALFILDTFDFKHSKTAVPYAVFPYANYCEPKTSLQASHYRQICSCRQNVCLCL